MLFLCLIKVRLFDLNLHTNISTFHMYDGKQRFTKIVSYIYMKCQWQALCMKTVSTHVQGVESHVRLVTHSQIARR